MVVQITRALLDHILCHAAATPQVEVCGLLFGTPDHVTDARHTANVADDPACFFEIDPAALLSAHRAARAGGPQLIGCYHSHPAGRAWPSATDAALAAGDGTLWLITGGGEAKLFRSRVAGGFELLTLALI